MSDTRGPRPDLAQALEDSEPGLALFQTRTKRKAAAQRTFKVPQPSEDAIRLRAYLIWERTGKSKGAEECWHLAKKELER